MSYEILTDELYEDSKKDKKIKKKDKKININPIFIHIGLILIVGFFLFYYFLPFDSKIENKLGNIVLVGNLESFNKTYNGNLEFYSKEFTLETKDILKGNSKDFIIENFSGNIYLENKSIVFDGTANKIKYDNNNINLNSNNFKLTSNKKTNFKLILNQLNLKIIDGKLKVDSSLNYNFKNSTMEINNINASINYDGVFSISGNTKKFNLKSEEDKLNIIFENE